MEILVYFFILENKIAKTNWQIAKENNRLIALLPETFVGPTKIINDRRRFGQCICRSDRVRPPAPRAAAVPPSGPGGETAGDGVPPPEPITSRLPGGGDLPRRIGGGSEPL